MAVRIDRLWRSSEFHNLFLHSKLTYLYFCTHSNLNSVGLVDIALDIAKMELSLTDALFREACQELVDGGFIKVYSDGKRLHFLVLGHFETLPRSVAVSKKAKKDIKTVPERVLDMMIVDGVFPDIEQHTEFKEPTVEEIESYALSLGYLLEGQAVVDFYRGKAESFGKTSGWYDSNKKEVRDWKAKIRKVWLRDKEKMEPVEGAPKGFEFFSVKDENGKFIRAVRWKDGRPYGSSVPEDKILQQRWLE